MAPMKARLRRSGLRNERLEARCLAPGVQGEHGQAEQADRDEQPARGAGAGVVGVEREHEEPEAGAQERGADPVERGGAGCVEPALLAAPEQQPPGAEGGEREVEPEDEAPAADGRGGRGQRGAVQRSEDAAGFLHRCHVAQRGRPALVAIEVGGEGERKGDQPAPAQALEESARHEPGEDRGRRREDGAGGKDQHAERVDRRPPAHIRIGAEQRHGHDVATEKAGHDRGRLFEAVDGQPDVGDHCGQEGDDDVGVEGGDEEPGAGDEEEKRTLEGQATAGVAILTLPLNPLRSTSTELGVPLSPNRPDRIALRMR